MHAQKSVLILAVAFAFSASAFAERAKRQADNAGARARHPSVSGKSSSSSGGGGKSVSSGSSASSSDAGQSSGSEYRVSRKSRSSSSRVSRSDAARRHPQPQRWRRHRPVRVASYWPYRSHYSVYSHYPYWGYYDGYYYGYYGWRAPYWRSGIVYHYDRDFGSLRIMVHPEHAEVFVDGYFAGIVDDFNGIFQRLHLRPGRHAITLKCDGYRTHRIKVFVPIEHTVKIRFDMQPGRSDEFTEEIVGSEEDIERADDDVLEPEGVGLLKLSVRPNDASVYIDGEHRGSAREVRDVELPVGVHLVEVVRPGFETYESEVDVLSDESARLEIELESLRRTD